jgi:hypothetical protein
MLAWIGIIAFALIMFAVGVRNDAYNLEQTRKPVQPPSDPQQYDRWLKERREFLKKHGGI